MTGLGVGLALAIVAYLYTGSYRHMERWLADLAWSFERATPMGCVSWSGRGEED